MKLNRFPHFFPSPPKNCFGSFVNNNDDDDGECDDDSYFDLLSQVPQETGPFPDLVGSQLDVIKLLSNGGKTTSLVRNDGLIVPLNVIRGKHLLVCCVSLPILSVDDCCYYCLAMIEAYIGLPRHRFEMVMVVKMKTGYERDESLFNYFFSAFPCLAIPFADSDTRHSICSVVGFNLNFLSPHVSAVVLNSRGLVLHHKSATENFLMYGSQGFHPFSDKKLEDIRTEDEVLRMRLDPFHRQRRIFPKAVEDHPLLNEPLSLHEILCCHPDDTFGRVGIDIGCSEPLLTVSDLSKRHLGLYLCFDGDFLVKLHKVHQQCIANKQQLEIMVVCLPLLEQRRQFLTDLCKALKHLKITLWFILGSQPVCRMIWRVFGKENFEDRLIILPPGCKSGELDAKAVIEDLRGKYPFTRSSVKERRLTALRALTPASLFKGTRKNHTCLVRNGSSYLPLSELQGKKLLLYLDWHQCQSDKSSLFCWLIKHYPQIQAMNGEIIFIPLGCSDGLPSHANVPEVPFLMMPFPASLSAVKKLFFGEEPHDNQLIAFGEDGRIRARSVETNQSLFADKLDEEITRSLALFD